MAAIRPMVRSLIRPAIRGALGSSTDRTFLDFDSTANSYLALSEAWTATGDFEIEVEFATTETGVQCIVGTETHVKLEVSITTGFVKLLVGDGIWWAVINQEGTISVTDGKLHTIKATKVGTTYELIIDGVSDFTVVDATTPSIEVSHIGARSSASAFFNGTIANVRLTDLDTPSNSLFFNLDEPLLNFEYSTINGIGSDVATNGGFDADTNWTKGTGWSIGSGVASCDGTQSADSYLSQSIAFASSSYYQVTYTISNYSAGTIYSRAGAVSGGSAGAAQSANGTYTEVLLYTSGGGINLVGDLDFTGDVDNVVIKLITRINYSNLATSIRWQAALVSGNWVGTDELVTNGGFDADLSGWTAAAGVTQSSGKAALDGTQPAYGFPLQQSSVAVVGNIYIAKHEVSNISQDATKAIMGTLAGTARSVNGTYTDILQATGNTSFNIQSSTGAGLFIGSVDNISVKRYLEVEQQTPDKYMLEFDSTANSYLELSEAITFAGDFEVEVSFATTQTTGFPTLFSTLTENVDGLWIYIAASTGYLNTRFAIASALSWLTPTVVVNDGKLHTLKLTRVGNLFEMFIDGVSGGSATKAITLVDYTYIGDRPSASNYWNGTITNIAFTDITTPANSLSWTLGEPLLDFELPVENVMGSELWLTPTADSHWTDNGDDTYDYVGDGTSSALSEGGFTIGQPYLISFNVNSISGGSLKIASAGTFYTFNTTGSHSIVIEPASTTIFFLPNGTDIVTANLSSISIKEVTNALTYNNIAAATNREYFNLVDGHWIGQELVVNGGFDADSDWTKGTGWTISGDEAHGDGTGSNTELINVDTDNITAGYIYTTSFDITSYTSGNMNLRVKGNGSGGLGTTVSAVGSYPEVLTAGTNTIDLRLSSGSNPNEFDGSIDNVSVKRKLLNS